MNQQDLRQKQLQDWINQQTKFTCDKLEMVFGDASFRRYFRFNSNGLSIIAVDAPPQFEDSHRFVEVSERYLDAGIPVPSVLEVDYSLGFYCQDDFGDRQFSEVVSAENASSMYQKALSFLPVIQTCEQTRSGPLPEFNKSLLEAEFYLFSHWLVNVHLELTLSHQESQILVETFARLQKVFLTQPQAGMHRDYHSRNLMLLENDNIGIIDFQDAVTGPITYDAVSLLRDCYKVWPNPLVIKILKTFHGTYYSQHSWEEFKYWFDMVGLQRHIKASGIFARLSHRDGKDGYLKDVPRTLDYLISVGGGYPELTAFVQLVEQKIKPAMELKRK